VVFILDRSGSMGGTPLEQAKKAVTACLGALSDQDQFGVIAFDDRLERFQPRLVKGDLAQRRAAERFLAQIQARGGTELEDAIQAGMAMARNEGADLLVATDG
jgi:Ca-activated chloride channel family protein